jgi:hypothetical protein
MLTTEQIEFFRENGYLIVGQILTDDEVTALRERADWIASGQAPHVPVECRQVEPRVAQGELEQRRYCR